MGAAERSERMTLYDGFISYSHAADELLAPRLQAGLQRFAKPWWKRRALRIFRDESSLSANPHLWSSITEALDTSGWFVLLLSPDAASSEWVNQEIEYWKTNRDPSRILPVVTDGEFGWDGDVVGSAVPEALLGVLSEEPRSVDLRFARDDEQLDLKNPRFSAAVADIASALHGVPKDELESEEVRQHRRVVRLSWSAVGLLVLMIVATSAAAIYAVGQQREAESLALLAERNAAEAQAQADAAREAETRAIANEAIAIEEAAVNESRQLRAAASLVIEQSQLAMLLLLHAHHIAPTDQTSNEASLALGDVLRSDRLLVRFPLGIGDHWAALSTDSQSVYHASRSTDTVRAFSVETQAEIWEYSLEQPGDSVGQVGVDPGGRWVSVAVEGERDRVLILEASSGRSVVELPSGGCRPFELNRFSWDGRWISVSAGTDDCGKSPEADWAVVYDTDSWTEAFSYKEDGAWYEFSEFLGDRSDMLRSHWDLPFERSRVSEGGSLEILSDPPGIPSSIEPTVEMAVVDPAGRGSPICGLGEDRRVCTISRAATPGSSTNRSLTSGTSAAPAPSISHHMLLWHFPAAAPGCRRFQSFMQIACTTHLLAHIDSLWATTGRRSISRGHWMTPDFSPFTMMRSDCGISATHPSDS